MANQNQKIDLVIIGSGIAGVSASVAASEKGIHSIVLEKAPVIGGISVTGMGIFAVERSIWMCRLNMTLSGARKTQVNHFRNLGI